MMSDKLQKFTDLMQGIFELDKSDLDFGIYRIMNIRKSEIEKFLNVDLIQKVQDTLKPFASNTGDIEARIKEIERACDAVGMDVSGSKMADEYVSLKAQLLAGLDMAALETDVYSALFSFFNRYYDEGDFISKRRYKEGVYAIPYEGEEVKLYWANHDQYYIKTTENFKDYSFKDGELTVHFRLVDATTEQNNNKESGDNKRVFMLYDETEERPELKTIEQNGNELIIRLIFDVSTDKKKKHMEDSTTKIVDAITKNHKEFFPIIVPRFIDSKTKRQTKSLLDKHLEAYVAKNTFDYFIHKDLHGFLTRELDFYIKSEIIHLDDLDTTNEKRVETYLAKVKAIKRIGRIIIDFLAQIEEFQKKLWLKKKFIIDTNWCITLDKIDETFYPEIIENTAQIQEWIDMYAINEIEGDLTMAGYSKPLTIQFLRQNLNLIVDTKHFTAEFKDRLIATFENIDEQLDGFLIHSENFQALNLIHQRFNGKVKGIYADPPYNTNASEILYKNGYKDSSWISMMNDRIQLANRLLTKNAIVCYTIDDLEVHHLSLILDQNYGASNHLANTIIRNNPSGRSTVRGFSINHEYALFYAVSNSAELGRLPHNEGQKKRYDLSDDNGVYEWENFRKNGTDSDRSDRPKQFFPIVINKPTLTLRIPNIIWNSNINIWEVEDEINECEEVLMPLNGSVEKVWKYGLERTRHMIAELKVKEVSGKFELYRKKYLNEEGSLPRTWWDKPGYSARDNGTRTLTELFGKTGKFDFPKAPEAVMDSIRVSNVSSNEWVLDFFAGSGTTGHAVIALNRLDSERRKFLLIEMGDYFNEVTKPRVLKTAYSALWKDGKPESRNTGLSKLIKYIRLESYEDALSNIELSEKGPQMQALFGEEYLVNYMLNVEAEGNLLKLNCFKTPFEYKLKVNVKNETIEHSIDLVETFNYLIGLFVSRQSSVAYFNAVSDEQGSYEGSVRLVKDGGGIYAFKQVEGILPDGRSALIIWRNISDNLIESNAALDAYFVKHRINPQDREFDIIYVNGDNNLENLRTEDEGWKVRMTEVDFKKHMFEGV